MSEIDALKLAERLLIRCQGIADELRIDAEANEGHKQLVEKALKDLGAAGGVPFSEALPHIMEQVQVAYQQGRGEGALDVIKIMITELKDVIGDIREE